MDLGKDHIITRTAGTIIPTSMITVEDGMAITETIIKGAVHVKSVADMAILQRTINLGTKRQQEISEKYPGTTPHHKHILQWHGILMLLKVISRTLFPLKQANGIWILEQQLM